ncbi:MAG: hypothetical protein ACFFG0_19580, partial [Candidatus Thorarchaeota archaeon]
YASPESLNRPLLYRYDLRLRDNYRVPLEARFLILLPELEVKGYKSPSIKRWLDEIDNNIIIPRNLLHVGFISDFFGIIPLELSSTFPMGQYESIESLGINDILYQNVEHKFETFFKMYGHHYNKCGVLIPDKYVNQFNEETGYTKREIMINLFEKIRLNFSLNISIFNELSGVLEFFKVE